jgi:sensor histidine kinase YesM
MAQAARSSGFFNKSARFWVLAAFGWTMIAVIAASSAFVALKGQSYTLWSQLFSQLLIYYYLWALLAPASYFLLVRLPFKMSTAPWVVLLHLVFLGISSVLLPIAVNPSDWRDWVIGERAVSFHTMNTISYSFVLAAGLVVKYYRIARHQERETRELSLHNLRLENQLNLARIDSLKMQINPHFLFNTLNSIGALVETQRNDEAYETLETLGALLRHALLISNEQRVPLKNELAFVELYLSIERLRYGNRLRYLSFIDEGTEDLAIPALILQPLVENSIKHAVGATSRPVEITLRAQCRDGHLFIDVEDDGPDLSSGTETEIDQGEARPGTGIGLNNVAERLKLLYKGQSELKVERLKPHGFAVRLKLPEEAFSGKHTEAANTSDSVDHSAQNPTA